MNRHASRLACLAAVAASLLLGACDRKPSTPPKPSTLDSPGAEPRPVDFRFMT